jgi:O-antigen/teichoic acid export membrane protein
MLRKYATAIATRGVSAGLSLASTSFIAHELGREDLGIYLALLGLGQIVAGTVLFGLDVTPAYLVRLHARHSSRLYWIFSALSLVAAGLGVLLYIPSNALSGMRGDTLSIAPFLYAATTVLMTVQMVLLQGFGRFSSSQAMQIAFPAIFLGLAFTFKLMFGGLTDSVAVLLWSVAGAACAIMGAAFVGRSPLGKAAESEDAAPLTTDVARKAFSYGAAVYVGNLVSALNVRLPALLAPFVIGESYGGYFAGVLFLHDVFGFFSFAIVSITLSSLAGVANSPYRDETIARACRINTALTSAAAAGMIVTFSIAIPLLLGPDFANLKFFLMIVCMAPITVIHSTIRILCSDFASQGRPGLNIGLNLVSICTLCALFPLAGRGLGEWGALLAFAGATAVFSILALYLYARTTSPRIIDYFIPNAAEVRSVFGSVLNLVQNASGSRGSRG